MKSNHFKTFKKMVGAEVLVQKPKRFVYKLLKLILYNLMMMRMRKIFHSHFTFSILGIAPLKTLLTFDH